MSKTTKFFKHPILFFSDARKKKLAAQNKSIPPETSPETKKTEQIPVTKMLPPASALSVLTAKAAHPSGEKKVTQHKAAAQPKTTMILRSQSFYLEKILDLKRAKAVNLLKYKNYNLWPALRSELMIQCDIAWKRNIQNEIAFNPYQSQLCRPSNVPFERGSDLASNFDCFSYLDDMKEENTDFLFFSNLNSTDQVEVGGEIYNRLVDPLYECAKKIGATKKIEIIKAASPAIDKIRNYHNIPVCIIPPYVYKYGFSEAVQWPKKFLQTLREKIPFIAFNEERVNSFFDWHLHMLEFYRDLLSKFNPKVVFFHPFYYYTPLIAAARERGIKTVDIQHGVMVGYNSVFYDNWQETPQSGYQALPDYFLVWSELEERHLAQVFSHVTGGFTHRALVSGYPWLDYSVALDKREKSRLRKIRKFVESGKKSILVTLQRDSFIPKNITAIITTSGEEVRWIIRRHPKGNEFNSPVKKLKNVIFGNDVDAVELRDLFKMVDYNFTDGSSTVLEADYFGVYSFVYGNEGHTNYKDLIDAGCVGLISDALTKYEELNLDGECRDAKIGYFKSVDTATLLKKILASSA